MIARLRGMCPEAGRCMRVLVSGLALASAPAMAQLAVNVAPDPLPLGGAARLTLSLAGDAAAVRSGVAFSVDLPAGLLVTSPALGALDCHGSLMAAPGGNRIELSGISQAVNEDCTATVYIEASSIGNYTIATTDASVEGAAPLAAALADLDVVDDQPVLTLSYSGTSVRWRERLSVTYSVATPSASLLTGVSLEDRLPRGWSFVDELAPQVSCDAGDPGVVSAVGRDFSVAGATFFAAGTCDYTLQVEAGSVGLQSHAAALTYQNSPVRYAVAGVDVVADEVHLDHVFEGVAVPGSTLDAVYTLNNTSRGDATAITFSHDLDSVLAGLVLAGAPEITGCGPDATVSGTSMVAVSGGQLAAGDSCSIVVPVSVPAGAAVGEYASTTGVVAATLYTAAYAAPAPSAATLQVAARPSLSREFLVDTAADGETVTLEYTLRNSSSASSLTGFSFTEDFSAFFGGFVAIPAPGSCGAGSSFGAASTSGSLFANALTVPAGDSCTFRIELDLAAPAGEIHLAAITAAGNVDGDTQRALVSGDTLQVLAAPRIQLSLSEPRVEAGGGSRLTVRMGESAAANDLDAALPAYSDLRWDLDVSGVPAVIASALPLSDTCGTGSQLSLTSGTVSLDNASLAPGNGCEVTLDLQVASDATAGDYPLVLSGVLAEQEGLEVSGPDRSVSLAVDALTIAVATSAQPVAPGDSLAIEVAFSNPSAATELYDVGATLALQNEIPGITVDAVTIENAACPTLTASNPSAANVVIEMDTLGPQVEAGCSISIDVTLDATTGTGDYPLRLQNARVTYGTVGAASSPVVAPLQFLSVVAPGEPRDLSPLALAEPDPDGDGASTAQEEAVGDGNGDGLPDALQDTVASGFAADGSAAISVVIPAGSAVVSAFSTLPTPEDAPRGVIFPFGFVGFQVSGVTAGATQTVEVHVPYNPDINAYWKQNRDGDWANIATSVAHSEVDGRTVVTLQLVEGGPFDIESPNVADTITDPGGPGILPPAEAIPAVSPVVLLLAMLSLAGLALRANGRR